jgi:hypothetical protein
MKRIHLILTLMVSGITVSAQKPEFQMKLSSFFDNTEFGYSKIQMPQTMAGIHVEPTFGISFQETHSIHAGVNLLHEFGSDLAIGSYDPIAYYQFENKPFRFLMGAFPRENAVDKYPRIFFQDSISYYRPAINGLVWQFIKNNSYANVWLDWTSRQTTRRHEAFFMGWSGRLSLNWFYVQQFAYMFHFAGIKNPAVDEALHDNGLILSSLGIDLAKQAGFEKLEINVGYVAGLERARAESSNWHIQKALLSEVKAEYRGVGIMNTYYRGDGQMYYYKSHRNELYWGDPLYQASTYNRTDMYINFLNSEVIKARFTYSLHFAEGATYHEQMLKVSFDINRHGKKEALSPRYLWSNWFN